MPSYARELWLRIETIHAVSYFAPECRRAADECGMKGFWMGYFGFRAAPMGPVGVGTIEATFSNFARRRIARAIPDAWSYASPDTLIAARSRSAAEALRRVQPVAASEAATGSAERAAVAVRYSLARVIDAGQTVARPLFAANRLVARFEDPVEQLWQQTACIREHRGDGHLIALASEGISGLEASVLHGADAGTEPDLFLWSRGWTRDEWDEASAGLGRRGLLKSDGSLTASGATLRRHVEDVTDRLATTPIEAALSPAERDSLLDALTPLASAVSESGFLAYPNPIGLPAI